MIGRLTHSLSLSVDGSEGLRKITDQSETKLEDAADGWRHHVPSVGGFVLVVSVVDAQSGCNIDHNAKKEQGGYPQSLVERHMKLQHNKCRQSSAEKVGESINYAHDKKEYATIEALVGICRIAVPDCLEGAVEVRSRRI